MKEQIQTLAARFGGEIVDIRRHLHSHPELSYHEHQTSAYIAQRLDAWGIPYQKGFVQTGILGRIEGRNPRKRIIALRADMDALPIDEANEVAYRSQNKGVMHACGHDVHSASLLGTARILNELRHTWEGTILLVFQPAEELLPGGAKLMMDEGVFADWEPELIIGQHVMPQYPVGTLGFRPGMYMASTDELYITVRADGGHGALPHLLTDTVLVAAHIVVALQQIASRNAPPEVPTVLSIGKIQANGATNIIPAEAILQGTFRTMNEGWRAQAHRRIEQLAKGIAESMGATAEVEIRQGYPFLVNHERTTQRARSFAAEYLGEQQIIDMDLRMTGEDFAYYSQRYPATFYRLGVRNDAKLRIGGLHTSTFDIDEDALLVGMGAMAYLAYRFMQE